MLSMVAMWRSAVRRSGEIRPIAVHAPLNSSISATRSKIQNIPWNDTVQ